MAEGPAQPPSLLRSAGILTAGRQVGALALTGATLALPTLLPRAEVDLFLWLYFGQLLVSSVCNLGLERLTARNVAIAPATAGSTVRSALRARVVVAPLTVAVLAATFAIVRIGVAAPLLVAVTIWTLAVQAQGVVFAGLRARGEVERESIVLLGGRLIQAMAVLALAARGAGPLALIVTLAVVEIGSLIAALAGLPTGGAPGFGADGRRLLFTYTCIELVAFAYLRADLLITGRLLGAHDGATYGLAYRVLDALSALATPMLLLVFPRVAALAAAGADLGPLRRRLRAVVGSGAVLGATTMLLVPVAIALVERLGEADMPLRLLVASVPLTFALAVEVHVASARGENALVVAAGIGALVTNVVANFVLVPRYGLVGAAATLLISEAVFAVGLAIASRAVERLALVALAPSATLIVGAVLLDGSAVSARVGILLMLAVVLVGALDTKRSLGSSPRPGVVGG